MGSRNDRLQARSGNRGMTALGRKGTLVQWRSCGRACRAQVRLAAIVLNSRFAYLFGHSELVRQAIAATGMPLTDGEPTDLHVDRCGLNVPNRADLFRP
jgi:hypothetical protein